MFLTWSIFPTEDILGLGNVTALDISAEFDKATDKLSGMVAGSIFNVNDVSGIPSIEVLDTGLIKLGQYNGNIVLGSGTDNGNKLQIAGSGTISGDLSFGGNIIRQSHSSGYFVGSYNNVGSNDAKSNPITSSSITNYLKKLSPGITISSFSDRTANENPFWSAYAP